MILQERAIPKRFFFWRLFCRSLIPIILVATLPTGMDCKWMILKVPFNPSCSMNFSMIFPKQLSLLRVLRILMHASGVIHSWLLWLLLNTYRPQQQCSAYHCFAQWCQAPIFLHLRWNPGKWASTTCSDCLMLGWEREIHYLPEPFSCSETLCLPGTPLLGCHSSKNAKAIPCIHIALHWVLFCKEFVPAFLKSKDLLEELLPLKSTWLFALLNLKHEF